MNRAKFVLMSMMLLASPAVRADDDKPVCDTEIATVSTAFFGPRERMESQTAFELRRLSLSPRADRANIAKNLSISYALGNPDAPLVFVNGGLGAGDLSGTSVMLMELLQDQGLNVVSVPSAFTRDFTLGFSSSGRPGLVDFDLPDQMRLWTTIRSELRRRHGLTTERFFYLGVSLAAFNGLALANSPWAAMFGFERWAFINPPINIVHAYRAIDRFADEGRDWTLARRSAVTGGLAALGQEIQRQGMSAAEIQIALTGLRQQQDGIGGPELRFMIGQSLRGSVQEVAALSQDIRDDEVFRSIDRGGRIGEAHKWRIEDYFEKILKPFALERQSPEQLALQLTAAAALESLSDRDGVLLIHAEDDFLLAPGDTDLVRRTLGDRAKIFDCGGHVGELARYDVIEAIVNWAKDDE